MRKPTKSILLRSTLSVVAVSVWISPAYCKEDINWDMELAPFVGSLREPGKTEVPADLDMKLPNTMTRDGAPAKSGKSSKSSEFFASKRAMSRDIILDVDKDKKDEQNAEDEEELEESAEDKLKVDLDSLESDDPQYFLKQAIFHIKAKQYRTALEELNKCISLDSRNHQARYLGAFVYQLQGRDEEAISRYRSYLEIRPDDVQANVNLGALLRKTGEYAESEECLKHAVHVNFYSLEAHYNLSNLFLELGKLEEALKELKICNKFDANNAMVHNNLGVIYMRRNYKDEAEEEFRRALSLDPANRTFEKNLQLVRGQNPANTRTATSNSDFL
ncbi:MAG: tetratricopeptide repeat protein [Cyanobacteria bacterium]|nr:tetratricopeptide repeat protein [Cyanobacteriota bacterium]